MAGGGALKADASGVKRDRVWLVVVALVVVVLVAVGAYTCSHRPFISPLTVISPVPVYLPLVVRFHRSVPDGRFGIAEHGLVQMLILGFPNDGRYHSVQTNRQPEETDTVRFLRPASRDPTSTWQLGAYNTEIGRWSDEAGFRQFVRSRDDVDYIVGNELSISTPVGDSHVTPTQYAQWYRDAWELIKSENPTVRVGPFGPVAWSRELEPVWDAYLHLAGEPMPVDFYPVHKYMWPGQTSDDFWRGLMDWIGWLESYRGRAWVGREYWLTEFGLPEWGYPDWVTPELALEFMADIVPRLKENDLGIATWVWWYSGRDTALIRGTTITPAGERYLQLALE